MKKAAVQRADIRSRTPRPLPPPPAPLPHRVSPPTRPSVPPTAAGPVRFPPPPMRGMRPPLPPGPGFPRPRNGPYPFARRPMYPQYGATGFVGRVPRPMFVRKKKTIWRRLLESKPHEYRSIKTIFLFPVGLFVGVGLYLLVLKRMQLPASLQVKVALYFTLFCGVGFALFLPFRCITTLLGPTLFGYHGRTYVQTYLVTYVLTGPINTMLLNGREVGRAVMCSFDLAFNQSKTYLALRLVPIIDIIYQLQNNAIDILSKCEDLRRQFLPLSFEVEDMKEVEEAEAEMDEVDRALHQSPRKKQVRGKYTWWGSRLNTMLNNYRLKLDFRCNSLFSRAVLSCVRSMKQAEQRCYQKIPRILNHMLCWPMKLTFFCKIADILRLVLGSLCRIVDAVKNSFMRCFDSAITVTEKLDEEFVANIQYKVVDTVPDVTSLTPEEVKSYVDNQIRRQTRIITLLIRLVDRLMIFLYVTIIYSAHSYHIQYLQDAYHDNKYITGYFYHVDDRRHRENKRTLLPLKKMEQVEIAYPFSLTMTDKEFDAVWNGTSGILLRAFFIGFILFIDRLFYTILDILSRHSHIDFHQKGKHHIYFEVVGTGLIAQVLQAMFKGMNVTHEVDNYTSTGGCLPQPVRTTQSEIVKIYTIVLIDFLLLVFECYALRLRPLICAFFYRKREKCRVLTLYNDMMRRRHGFLQLARHRIKKSVQQDKFWMEVGFWTAIRRQFPKMCWCLVYLGIGRQACVICGEQEDWSFVKCPTKGCKAAYCIECWRDVHRKCYACRDEDDWTVTSEGQTLSSEDKI